MAFRGHFQTIDVHETLRGFKNPLHAAAENVHFVRGLEPPCLEVTMINWMLKYEEPLM